MNTKNRPLQLIAIILGFFMALLDTTIVNITLPKMTDYFHTTVQQITWIVNGYNLAFAVLLITASRLADQFGRKKIFMMGVAAFTITSCFSGISSSVEMLVVFRVLQGLSAALVVPVTMPLMVEIFPPNKRGAVIGIWGAFAGLAAASGPALGGILTQRFQWQSIFFINLPIGIICFILTALLIRESYDPTASKRIDWGGILTLSISSFTLTLALIQATDKGWGSTYILTLFGIALVSFAAFLIVESKVKEPMLPLWIMRIGPFAAGSFTLFMLGVGMMSGTFLLSFFLIQIMGMSELQAGLTITAMPLTAMVTSAISGPLSDKLGSRWFATLGMTLLTTAVFLFSSLTPASSHFDIVWRLIIAGAGMGSTMAPTSSATIRNVPRDKIGIASGITNMTRTMGTVLGVALLVTIFNGYVASEVSAAKEKAVLIVQSSTVFDQRVKGNIANELRNTQIFRESKPPQLEDILSKIDNAEKTALSHIPLKAQSQVKDAFQRQKDETKRVWPQISDAFTSGVVAAFSRSFKIGSVILLLGVLLAIFSDRSPEKNLVLDEVSIKGK